MLKSIYDTDNDGIVDNAEKVNNHTVAKDVPANAIFTDTVYDDTSVVSSINKNKSNIGGTDYDATQTYALGDIVKHEGLLYKCTTAITTAEVWTAAHWTQTSTQNQIDAMPKWVVVDEW